ncbi:MAG: GEVED domain-containing protein [Bacteroidales bacterium]|nr:GEVED domain-containing protein [Bacteroidales bacterium]
MKARLLFILTGLILYSIILKSQTTVTVGSNTYSNLYMPIAGGSNYSYTQQIVYQNQINMSGNISVLRFYIKSEISNANSWTIFMGHTSKTQFNSTLDWVPVSSLTEVFNGNVTFNGANTWVEITLSTPFLYNNTDNLIIAVDENTSGGSYMPFFAAYETFVNRGMYIRSTDNIDPLNPSVANNFSTTLNYLQLGIAPQGPYLSISPGTLDFGFIQSGSQSIIPKSFTISGGNLSSSPLTVSAPNDFIVSLSSNSNFLESIDVNFTPPSLSTTTVYVNFAPTGIPKAYSDTIKIDVDGITNYVFVSGNSNNYCSGGADPMQGGLDITRVQFGSSLNNYSACNSLVGTQGTATGTISSYSNFTGIAPTVVQQGETVSVTVEISECGGGVQSHYVYVYIDFNQDIDFDDPGETFLIYPSASSGIHTVTENINIPIDAYIGNTRMRVVCNEFCGKCSVCGKGETEDYNINIFPASDCLKPENLAASNISTSTADLSWTVGGSETKWNIEYGPQGFALGQGTFVSGITSTSYQLTGLNHTTSYAVYIQADCLGNNLSMFEGPYTFITNCGVFSLPLAENFNDAEMPACWSQTYSGGITSNRWNVNNTTNAGGQLPKEMQAVSQMATGISRLITPAINTTGYNTVDLSFKTAYSDFGQGLTLKIQSSSDKINWTDEDWSYSSGSGDITASDINLTITNNLGATTYLAWVIEGHHFYFNAWYIDEVRINAPPSYPVFDINTTAQTYDSTEIYTNNILPVVVMNSGMDSLIITGVQMGGADASDFGLENLSVYPKKLGNGQKDTILVAFEPQSIGQKTATLTVSYNDGSAKTQDVSLSGKAFEFPQGSKCYNPIVINSFPYLFNQFSTQYSNDYSSTDITPNSDYLSGNDVVFSFTVTESKRLSASIGFSWTGVFLLDACPNSTNPPHVIASAYGPAGGSFADKLLQPGQYYLIASCWGPPNDVEIYFEVSLQDPVNLIVSNTHEVINTSASYDNVDINPNGSLTIESGNVLNVAGNLTIHSDAGGTGSLINLGTLTVQGNTLVEKYLETGTSTGWTLSLPVTSAPASVFDGSDNIWFYEPALASWQSFSDNDLNIMTGYVVRFPHTTTIEFQGNLLNNSIGKTLYRYTNPNNYGWNYVGNPYPSPLDWDANPGVTRTNINNAIYFRKTDGSVATYVAGVGTNGGTSIIPAMQAFWVQVTLGQTTGTLQLTSNAQVHAHGVSYKTSPQNVLKIHLTNEDQSDETAIRFTNQATEAFDKEFDAVKMTDQNNNTRQIYSLTDNEVLAINALPEIIVPISVPVGFTTNTVNNNTLTFSGLSTFDNDIRITLEDMSTTSFTDIRQQNTYTFSANALTDNDRFVLHFNKSANSMPESGLETSDIFIYSYDNAIYISNVSCDNVTVSIYNVLGQEVLNRQLMPSTLNKITSDLPEGTYIVKLTGSDGLVSQKIFLK